MEHPHQCRRAGHDGRARHPHPGRRRPYLPVPYVWSDQFERRTQVYGHVRGHDEAAVVADGEPAGRLDDRPGGGAVPGVSELTAQAVHDFGRFMKDVLGRPRVGALPSQAPGTR